MWALDGLAGVFDWAAGRFWEAADFCRDFDFWGLLLGRHPLEGLEPHIRGLAHFCWTARDRVRDFAGWIDGHLADLRLNLYYLRESLRLEIEYRVRQAIDALTGGIDALRQKAEDAWDKANELWNIIYPNIKPTLDWLSDRFWGFKSWVENTALPDIRLALYYAKENLLFEIRWRWDRVLALIQDVADLDRYRDTWNFILNSYQILTFTFVDSWDRLKAFLVDPPGSIWAWLEPILLDRVEQFLNERWDTRR